MMGSSPAEGAQVDQLGETVRDIKDAYQKVRGIKDEAEKKTAMEKWCTEDIQLMESTENGNWIFSTLIGDT